VKKKKQKQIAMQRQSDATLPSLMSSFLRKLVVDTSKAGLALVDGTANTLAAT
jgi:hypothetical protein